MPTRPTALAQPLGAHHTPSLGACTNSPPTDGDTDSRRSCDDRREEHEVTRTHVSNRDALTHAALLLREPRKCDAALRKAVSRESAAVAPPRCLTARR